MPGNSCPRAMPTMMQSATQKVRKRSKTPIAGFAAAGAAPAAVAVSGLYGLFLRHRQTAATHATMRIRPTRCK